MDLDLWKNKRFPCAFALGMPTSYWQAEIRRLNQPPSWTHSLLERVGATHQDFDYVGIVTIVENGGSTVFVPQNQKVPSELLNQDPAMLPVVIALLRAGDTDTQVVAACLLSRFGAQGGVAVSALRDTACVTDGRVRQAALTALAEIDPYAAADAKVEAAQP